MKILSTDVLVVGSGAAGLRAAIAVRQSGLKACVVGKSSPGDGTCTGISGGGFSGAWGGLSPEQHKANTFEAGRGLNNPELVEIMVAEAPIRFQEMRDWGLKVIDPTPPGILITQGKGPARGREIIRCLMGKAQEVGVDFVDHLVIRAIQNDRGATCMVAYCPSKGEWIGLVGRAAILAAGGAGGLYARHDNPPEIVGDAYALGYEAGATLQDMEFIQFHPMGLAEPGLPPSLVPPLVADQGFVTNTLGEDLLQKYGITVRPALHYARDRVARALFEELEIEGHEVLFDLTKVRREDWRDDLASEHTWEYFCDSYGAHKRPLRVAPVAHFFMGGISTDGWGATSLPGLYAAGEAVGGLHGANRLSSNSLTETIVFGTRAGKAAADWARNVRLPEQPTIKDRLTALVPGPFAGKPRADVDVLFLELQRAVWRHGGIRRNRAGLVNGLELISEINGEAGKTEGVSDPRRIQRFLELQMGCRAASIIFEAAIRRTESRGAHFREDFPQRDDAKWRGNLKVRLNGGQPAWSFKSIA